MINANEVLAEARALVAKAKAATSEGEKVRFMAMAIEAYTTIDTHVSANGWLPTEWNHCDKCAKHRRQEAPQRGHADE